MTVCDRRNAVVLSGGAGLHYSSTAQVPPDTHKTDHNEKTEDYSEFIKHKIASAEMFLNCPLIQHWFHIYIHMPEQRRVLQKYRLRLLKTQV